MKAAVLYGIKNLKIEEVEIPKPKEGEILIKVLYSLTCGTDLKTYERGHAFIKYPMIIGHEYVGEIIKVGENVKNFKEGDIVTGANSAPCFNCFFCNKKSYSLCENLSKNLLGFTVNGSFAEYMCIPKEIVNVNLYKVEDKNYKKYASIEPLACVIHAWEKLNVKEDDNVLIVGSGPIALLHLQVALLKTKNVFVLAKHKDRINKIKEFNVKVFDIENENFKEEVFKENNKGYDLVIEAVGKEEAWKLSFEFVRKGGTLLLFGGLRKGIEISFDSYKIHYGEVKILGSFHHDPYSVKKCFELIKNNKINTEVLITNEMKLENLEEALLRMAEGKEMKVGIIC